MSPLFLSFSKQFFLALKLFTMQSLMKLAFIGLLAISTAAFAGNGKQKTAEKKAQATQTCCPNCPHPCGPTCPPGCCPKKG
jgi:hypothetical protein